MGDVDAGRARNPPAADPPGRGLGLNYMKERARQTSGNLTVTSGRDGTAVTVFWPAEALGLSRRALYRRLSRHGL